MKETIYPFARGERILATEVYFPKKVELQGRIFKALKEGYDTTTVKKYFKDYTPELLTELDLYPNLFDPDWYDTQPTERVEIHKPTVERAHKRFDMYVSQFKGWTISETDGVWFDERGKPFEERTQIVRLMFRFKSK